MEKGRKLGAGNEEGLLAVVEAYAAFQRAHPGGDIDAFCRDRLAGRSRKNGSAQHAPPPMEARMGRVFSQLARMVAVYSKKVLQPLGVANLEDMGYLATLDGMGRPRKGELIRMMHSETTSGTSIIKRLVEHGWVRELPDPADGRSTRVQLTAAGKRVLRKCIPAMIGVGRMVFGVLDARERAELLRLLLKLHGPHAALLLEHRERSFEELRDALYGKRD